MIPTNEAPKEIDLMKALVSSLKEEESRPGLADRAKQLESQRKGLEDEPATTPTDAPTTREERLREAVVAFGNQVRRCALFEGTDAADPLFRAYVKMERAALATPQAPEPSGERRGKIEEAGLRLIYRLELLEDKLDLATVENLDREAFRALREAGAAAEILRAALASPDSAVGEPAESGPFIVIVNPRTKAWVVVDRAKGRILDPRHYLPGEWLYAHPPAEPPEEEREWRVVNEPLSGGRATTTYGDAEVAARAQAAKYGHRLQSRRVGPWQDVEAEEGGES